MNIAIGVNITVGDVQKKGEMLKLDELIGKIYDRSFCNTFIFVFKLAVFYYKKLQHRHVCPLKNPRGRRASSWEGIPQLEKARIVC